jgi:hypothetical protein
MAVQLEPLVLERGPDFARGFGLPWYPPPVIISPARVVGRCLRALFCTRDHMVRDTAALIGVSCTATFTCVAARCRSCSIRPRLLNRW